MKRKMRGVAVGAVAGACLASVALAGAGCTLPGQAGPTGSEPTLDLPFDPSNEMVEAVYGPPPEFENYPAPDGPAGNGGPGGQGRGMRDFDPSGNQNEDVYGPPEMFGAPGDEPYDGDADAATPRGGRPGGGSGSGAGNGSDSNTGTGTGAGK